MGLLLITWERMAAVAGLAALAAVIINAALAGRRQRPAATPEELAARLDRLEQSLDQLKARVDEIARAEPNGE